ncbi:hypothetical protein ASD45_18495 [Pseudolabrys sp. Root1462]|jgi:hypothetical protein|uniref:hypothetical protein n=1 Tax=Pseudolabrys sp. Root1462 TaxID=1736466 RepID=UPI000703ABE4|nr:hypothetical protein [Pseudolabrys sp. Root1462]KQY97976.1 hypothetical protein ASD45_18495 [Pseudolabrys sp. Root1462]
MADNQETMHRVLQMKIRALGEPAQVLALVQSTAPFYRALGGTQVRFLQNVDDPAQFVIEVEYEANAALEVNRQKISSDPMVRTFLQGWKTLLAGAAEMDVYQDVSK